VSWTTIRLKHLFSSVQNGIWGDEPAYDGTDVFCARGTDFDRTTNRVCVSKMPRRSIEPRALSRHQLRPGDLVLEKSGGSADQPVGSVAIFDQPVRAVCSNFNARLQVVDSVEPRFACYLMNGLYWSGFTRQFIKQTTGIQNLDADAFLAQRCEVPSIEEQRRVARFLDVETARIDDLRSHRTAQRSVLAEKERFVLDQIFVGDFSVRLRMKYLLAAKPRYGVLVPEFVDDGGVPFVRINDLVDLESKISQLRQIPRSLSRQYRTTVVRPGDVLVSVVGTLGRSTVASPLLAGANVNRAIAILRTQPGVSPELLSAWTSTSAFETQAMIATGNDSAQRTLGMEDLANFDVMWPADIHEQERVLRDLTSIQTAFGRMRRAIDRQLETLAERRQALIMAAVTGQIDVTTAGRFAAAATATTGGAA